MHHTVVMGFGQRGTDLGHQVDRTRRWQCAVALE